MAVVRLLTLVAHTGVGPDCIQPFGLALLHSHVAFFAELPGKFLAFVVAEFFNSHVYCLLARCQAYC